jgi:hypothetical protein
MYSYQPFWEPIIMMLLTEFTETLPVLIFRGIAKHSKFHRRIALT